jgi:hypothetical protein
MIWFSIGYAGELQQMLILMGDAQSKTVQIESLKLQLKLAQTVSLEKLFQQHKLAIKTQQFGHYHVLVVEPILSHKTRNALVMALGDRYHGMFFIERHRTVPSTLTQHVNPNQLRHPTLPFWQKMDKIDWLWTAIFLLAISGLTASILQRKRMFSLDKAQKNFKEDQERMDQEIETLQGEKHA